MIIIDTIRNDAECLYWNGQTLQKKAAGSVFTQADDADIENYMSLGFEKNAYYSGSITDDTYDYTPEERNMIIHDGGGNDTLVLAEEINETEIQLKRESNHLRVIITSEEHADVADNLRGVVFADYFTPSPVNKIEAIQVGENRYDTAKVLNLSLINLKDKSQKSYLFFM
ncbi:hypothetical protein [Candidatus Fukatsuia endosymbiont of Tuberolachnus salignus]|uniref:hypothetical protein n=1 Tax=Candidatus Fukatsuia endosymbiont of Tuberolachnus salignus TaxID=3077957 RepID=UPI00313D376F